MNISKKVCIVTGGASGLGRKIVDLLLDMDSVVVVLDINKVALENLSPHENLLAIKCDITKENEIEQALIEIFSKYKKVDILVNNAGILHSEPMINLMSKERRHSLENWKKVLDINLTAPFLLSSYIFEHMVTSRVKGIVINISSICSRGNAGQTAYSAVKAAVESMTRVWAKELGPMGIRSVAIAPGFMDTESTHDALAQNLLLDLKRANPLRRLGKAEEIAHAVKFVIENDFVNGAVIEINGGAIL